MVQDTASPKLDTMRGQTFFFFNYGLIFRKKLSILGKASWMLFCFADAHRSSEAEHRNCARAWRFLWALQVVACSKQELRIYLTFTSLELIKLTRQVLSIFLFESLEYTFFFFAMTFLLWLFCYDFFAMTFGIFR